MAISNSTNSSGKGAKSLAVRLGLVTLALGVGVVLSTPASAVTPVGSVISNQASASYTDGSGTVKSASSNSVTTTVTQVAALTLVNPNTKTVVAGSTAYMPHTLTNLGNGTDTFTFNIVDNATGFPLTSTALYLDADANGVPDSATPLCSSTGTPILCSAFTTPSLPAGGTYSFVLATQVPITATNGQSDTATITAKSVFDVAQTIANTDTVNVTTGPAFNITKSINIASGAASPASCILGSEASCIKVKYTLTYTNTGSAGNLYLSDVIGTGATDGMIYVPGSALWSSSTTPLTDVAGSETVSGIDYQAVSASGTATLQAVIANVGTGVSGTVTFDVAILSTATPGTSTTTNTGLYGVEPTTTVPVTPPTTTSTNPSPYTVGVVRNVVANNNGTSSTDGTNTPAGLDLVTVASAAPGTTVSFDNYIWNTGSSSDTFDITLAATNAFPSGTLFQIFKSDGATALTDSNGGGTPDTGPLAPGAFYKVVVKAIIPAGACSPTCPAGPFIEQVTATSVADATKSNLVFDQLTALAAPTVDLTNTAVGNGATSAAGNGDLGAYQGSTAPTTTNAIAGGATTGFPLYLKNSGSSADNYNLEYSTTNFVAGTVQAGWSVVFRTAAGDTSCTAGTGALITNSGSVAPSGGQVEVCAFVTTATATPAATYNVFFRVTSGSTGASDIKVDAVTINASPKLALTPNGSGQVFPGGSVVYPHVLANTGNTSCAGTFAFTLNNVLSGWSAIVYDDADGNGVIDTGEAILGSHNGTTFTPGTALSGPLAITGTHKLLIKVISPAGSSDGDTDNITVSVLDNGAGSCGTATANDATLVITGQLRLDKLQAIDALCDGTEDGAFVNTALTAKPGECIVYRITATNAGTTNVTAITLSDNTPSFTTYNSVVPLNCSAGAASAPASGAAGALSCGPIATMIPGATATMTFGVKVNP